VPQRFLVRRDRPPRGPVSHVPRRSDNARSIGSGTTVWPCGDEWLAAAVAKTVTTYTTPGDRVLFHSTGSTAPLDDTAWTVVRLGRRVVTGSTQESDFTLAVTVIDPRQHDLLAVRYITRRLRPGAVLAVITHAEQIDGHLRDRTASIVHSARSAGLRYHDHVILLKNDSATHADLLVFATPTEPSDD
jgi:hypothetical protein